MECSDLDESVEMDSHPSHGGGFIGESRAKVFNTSDGRAHQSSTNATTKEDNNSVTNTTDDEGKDEKITCSSLTIISNVDTLINNHSS